MANFTQAPAEAAAADAVAAAGTDMEAKTKLASAEAAAKASMAKDYFAYVKANGLNSKVIQSDGNSSRKLFAQTPGCFFHNPMKLLSRHWEIRGHFATNTPERTAALFNAWKEQDLQESKARANHAGKKHQFYGTQDQGVCKMQDGSRCLTWRW